MNSFCVLINLNSNQDFESDQDLVSDCRLSQTFFTELVQKKLIAQNPQDIADTKMKRMPNRRYKTIVS